jgi:hypothetical protein
MPQEDSLLVTPIVAEWLKDSVLVAVIIVE